jgi:hypothetical protein
VYRTLRWDGYLRDRAIKTGSHDYCGSVGTPSLNIADLMPKKHI